jgi:hypothetical protein
VDIWDRILSLLILIQHYNPSYFSTTTHTHTHAHTHTRTHTHTSLLGTYLVSKGANPNLRNNSGGAVIDGCGGDHNQNDTSESGGSSGSSGSGGGSGKDKPLNAQQRGTAMAAVEEGLALFQAGRQEG